jgi:N-acetylmuramoyl-L-alanine amidase
MVQRTGQRSRKQRFITVNIEQRPLTSGSFWLGHYDRAAICNHIMQGHIPGSEARFNDKKQEVSAHFGVGYDGRVVQWVSMDNSAWSNGILEPGWNVLLPWLFEAVQKNIEINRRTISIEHEGFPGEPMPEAQYQSTLDLHSFIIRTYPTIYPSRKTIVRHSDISPKSRANCPGSTFPLDRLINDLQGDFSMNAIPSVPGNFHVRDEFTAFWLSKGGLPIFGFPIGPEQAANGNFGNATSVQYFERARFELQPGGAVMLGLVGVEAFRARGYWAEK